MNQKRYISIYAITLIMVFLSVGCAGEESPEKLKSRAIEKMAGILNEDSAKIFIRTWMEVGEFGGNTSYVASFYRADQSEGNDYLGLFEMTVGGVFRMTCMNSSILNMKDNSADRKRIYEIISDYKYANGFCLSNGENRYYFVIRPQEDAREVMFCMSFRRELIDKKNMAVYEYLDNSYDNIPFKSFADYELRPLGYGIEKSIVYIPEVLNNKEELFFISSDPEKDIFNAFLAHYRPGQESETISLTEMELLESSYHTVQFKLKGRDHLQKERNVYLSVESSLLDKYDPRPQYPVTIAIVDKEDKEMTYKVTGTPEDRWSKCHVDDTRAGMLMSYYLPQDIQVIDVYATDFNNDYCTDYLVTAIYEENKESQSGIFIFTGNREGVEYTGMEKLGRMLISSATDREETVSVDWGKSLVDITDYIFTVNRSGSKSRSKSESFILRFNSKNRLYMTESWKVSNLGSSIEVNWKGYSDAYVFSDYMNKALKLKTDFDYTEKIPATGQENWFLKQMLSDRYSDEKKEIMAKVVYNSSFSVHPEEGYFNIIRMLCQRGRINEAYGLFNCLNDDSDILWGYPLSYYWAAYFAYEEKEYNDALEYLDRYMNKCAEDNCASMKKEAAQLKESINDRMNE